MSLLAEKVSLSILMLVIFGAVSFFILFRMRHEKREEVLAAAWITAILPFSYGGYYALTSGVVGLLLLVLLVRALKRHKGLYCCVNIASIGVAVMVLFYAVSILWAADQGSAPWGVAKFSVLLLYCLYLMQLKTDELTDCLMLVPLSGAAMVVGTFVLQGVACFSEALVVKGRLCGFYEYANACGIFLLIGVAVIGFKKALRVRDYILLAVLGFGILLTGSRISFVFMILVLIAAAVYQRNVRTILLFAAIFALDIGLSLLMNPLQTFLASIGISGFWPTETEATRFSSTLSNSSTLKSRLLFYGDMFPYALKHPFGIGYKGFAAVQHSVQSGDYSVLYVHCSLLQLMLDVGWIPAILLLVAIARALLDRENPVLCRVVLLVIAAYSMLDFHMEFLSVWLFVLPTLGLLKGNKLVLESSAAFAVPGVLLIALALWLGSSEICSMIGRTDLALALTPFSTEAQTEKLKTITDTEALDACATDILSRNQYSIIAWDARANAAYSRGDIAAVVEYKQKALACSRFSIDEYLDYFDKLDAARILYAQSGDSQSAEVCKMLILSIPELIDSTMEEARGYAEKTVYYPDLTLPEEYCQRLAELS